jgi:hypothetical protein
LITWQWAPDCRPARQAGQLLGLTRLGSIFSLTEFFGSSSLFCGQLIVARRCVIVCTHNVPIKKTGTKAGLSSQRKI